VRFPFWRQISYSSCSQPRVGASSSPPTAKLVNVLPYAEYKGRDPIVREIARHYRGLISSYQDQINFIKNYKLVELLLNDTGTKWMFTAMNLSGFDSVSHVLNVSRFLGFGIPLLDYARDHQHPGRRSHYAFVDQILPVVCASVLGGQASPATDAHLKADATRVQQH